jgi:hypothetical protein
MEMYETVTDRILAFRQAQSDKNQEPLSMFSDPISLGGDWRPNREEMADAVHCLQDRFVGLGEFVHNRLVGHEGPEPGFSATKWRLLLKEFEQEVLAAVVELYFMLSQLRTDMTRIDFAEIESRLDIPRDVTWKKRKK